MVRITIQSEGRETIINVMVKEGEDKKVHTDLADQFIAIAQNQYPDVEVDHTIQD